LFHDTDAEIMTVGIPSACSGSQISTSDGLYLLAGMKITNTGEAIALEMDVERGGFLDVKVLTIIFSQEGAVTNLAI